MTLPLGFCEANSQLSSIQPEADNWALVAQTTAEAQIATQPSDLNIQFALKYFK